MSPHLVAESYFLKREIINECFHDGLSKNKVIKIQYMYSITIIITNKVMIYCRNE